MKEHEQILYKRTQDGGYVFWKGELNQIPSGDYVFTSTWGNINGTPQTSTKIYNRQDIAEAIWSSTWKKKYSLGVYKTLNDVFITEPQSGVAVFQGTPMTLYMALSRALPALGSTPIKAPKIPKPPKPEPVEKINRNIKIVFQLPRLN